MDVTYNALQLLIDGMAVVLVVRASTRSSAMLGLVMSALLSAVWIWISHVGVFHLFRLYAFALFLHAPIVLLGLAWAWRNRGRQVSGTCLTAAALLLLTAGYAFVVEPRWLDVTQVRIESGKLTRSVRIAIVADLQTDRVGSYERTVFSRVMEADPDLILMPGDYLHESDSARRADLARQLRALLREIGLSAPLGVYATRGNVEDNDWPLLFEGLAITPLSTTETFNLEELQVTALDLWDSFDRSLKIPATSRYHITFGHAPDFALGSVEADLLIAGHTHGGQVRLPWFGPLLTFSSVPREWASGVTRLPGGSTLIVSRGIGMERGRAPRMRFLCRPELVFIDLHPRGTP